MSEIELIQSEQRKSGLFVVGGMPSTYVHRVFDCFLHAGCATLASLDARRPRRRLEPLLHQSLAELAHCARGAAVLRWMQIRCGSGSERVFDALNRDLSNRPSPERKR